MQILTAQAVHGSDIATEKMFCLGEVGKSCPENRLLGKNLTGIFSYIVSRALNTIAA